MTSCRPFFPSPPHRPDPRIVNPVKVPTISTLPPIPAYLPNNPPSPTTRPALTTRLASFVQFESFVVKPTRAIFLGDFAPWRETTVRHPHLPLRAFRVLRGAPVAQARTEYRSAEYEYHFVEYEYELRIA